MKQVRTSYILLLFVAVIFGGSFIYLRASEICAVPITYRIGAIDTRFDITEDEARQAMARAEAVWEDSVGFDLFQYDESSAFTVNFVFDERQALSDAEEQFRDRLDSAESTNEDIQSRYRRLVEEYEALEESYTKKRSTYESDLAAYNRDVARYNDEGGAPPDVFNVLEEKKQSLEQTSDRLSEDITALNSLGEEINALSEEGNELVRSYNQNVAVYNERFGAIHEFTQGEYGGKSISVYKFSSMDELVLVLAHEIGHALFIDHVENDASVMHYLMGGQSDPLSLTEEDREGFIAACGDLSLRSKLTRLFGV